MSILLLYESEEWSTYALQSRIQEQGIPCRLVCMERGILWKQFSGCDLVVSRVFASAQFRGHGRSLRKMPELIAYLKEKQIPMLNPYQAHFYEVSKELSTRVLGEHGLPVPKVYGTFQKQEGAGDAVESRIAHFFAYDDDGLYFRTMNTKPFYKQLQEGKKVSVCGMYPTSQVTHNENNLPFFETGYTMRISGDVRELSMEEMEAKAAHDRNFNVAVYDVKKYPATRIFVLYRAKGECYDYDYAKRHRDHKLERERFAYGGMEAEPAGLLITDRCIGCGKCAQVCTFDAIEPGDKYSIRGNRCDECGNCYMACPVHAIQAKGE